MSGTITKTNSAVTFIATTRAQVTPLLGQVGTSGAIYITTDTGEIFWADPTDSGIVKLLEGVITTDALPKSTSAYSEGTLLQVVNSPNNTEDGLYIACGASFIPIDSTKLNTAVSTSSNTSRVTITPEGLHSKAASFDIKGGNNVTISSASDTITISVPTPTNTALSPTTSAMSVETKSGSTPKDIGIGISFQDTASHTVSGSFNLKEGNNVTLAVSGNTITINAATPPAATTLTSATTSIASTTVGKAGVKLTHTITDSTGASVSTNFDMVGNDGVSVSVVNGQIQISGGDSVIRNLNPMTFKGVIGTDGTYANFAALANSTVNEIGDVYKVITAATATINNETVNLKVGDVIIVNGTEDPDTGYITSNAIYYVVPAGDEEYTPAIDKSNHSIKFTNRAGTKVAEYKVIAANGLTSTNATANGVLTETIKHVAITPATATAALTNSFVSGFDFDSYGHPKTVTYAPAHVAVTPSASSSTATTFINGLTFDTYGHVTAYTSATVDIDTNMYWHTLS